MDLHHYQTGLSTHQELLIDWDPHTGYDHPAWREEVAEGSLRHEFTLLERKQNVKGNAATHTLRLLDLGLYVIATTDTGEVRGVVNGPSLLMQAEMLPADKATASVPHHYIMGKGPFLVSLPDDPQIKKIVLLLAHPGTGQFRGKFRLEKVGTIDLDAKTTPK
jgi:hypothetical protein